MNSEREIIQRLSEKINYTTINKDDGVIIRCTFTNDDLVNNNRVEYSRCKEIATRKAININPKLKCTSYQSNTKKFENGLIGWDFYFTI